MGELNHSGHPLLSLPPTSSALLLSFSDMQPKCSVRGECSATQLPRLLWAGCASVPLGRQKPAGALFFFLVAVSTTALPCKLLQEPISAVVGRMPSWVSDSCKQTVLFPKGCQRSEAEIQKLTKLKLSLLL